MKDYGKPHQEVYNQSISTKKKKIIAKGENLRTDIKGANNMNYDSLLVTNGIHKSEIQNKGVEHVLKKYEVNASYYQSELKW